MSTRKFLPGLLALALMAAMPNPGLGQGAGPAEKPAASSQKMPRITLQGRIVYMKSAGGYLLISQKPHEEHKILNENAKVLAALAKERKTVTIEGTLPKGAYLLFIDKIDGQKYQGDK
jgi:hypothetical protein